MQLKLFVSIRQQDQQGRRTPICISTAPLLLQHCSAPTAAIHKSTNATARHARHVTTQRRPFPIIPPIGLSVAFLPSAFSAAPPPLVVSESAGANHHHLLPTKKSAVATLFFFLALGNSVFYFRSARPLNRVLPPDLQLRSIPNRVWTRAMQPSRAPCSRELGVYEAERVKLRDYEGIRQEERGEKDRKGKGKK